MNAGADVRSLEALQDWYSAVAQFRADGLNALTAVAVAFQHASAWLDEEDAYWQRAIRKAEERVSRARIELSDRQYQNFCGDKVDTTVQEKELRHALAELQSAEDRLAAVRRWMQKLPLAIQDVYQGPARRLEFFLDANLAQSLANLDKHLVALEQYLGVKPALRERPTPEKDPAPPAPPAPPAQEKEPT